MADIVAGLAGVPVAESAVSFRDGDRGVLEYRGYSLVDLAAHASFLETVFLLLNGELPTASELDRWERDVTRHRRLKFRLADMLKCMPEAGRPIACLQAAVAALRLFYPDRDDHDPEADYWSIVRLIAKLPTILAAWLRVRKGNEHVRPRDDLSYAANFLYMLHERVPGELEVRTLDACLVLHAEHTMNCSTFSARVTASALANPYAVTSAAMGTLSGPRIGGANERFLRMLEEIGTVPNVRPWLEARLTSGQHVMGFGDGLYEEEDPRTAIIRDLVVPLFEELGETKTYRVALALERGMAAAVGDQGVAPNVDFWSALLFSRLGIPPDAFVCLFAWARAVGWLAHWQEQIHEPQTYRPTQEYVGPRGRAWIPVEERA